MIIMNEKIMNEKIMNEKIYSLFVVLQRHTSKIKSYLHITSRKFSFLVARNFLHYVDTPLAAGSNEDHLL